MSSVNSIKNKSSVDSNSSTSSTSTSSTNSSNKYQFSNHSGYAHSNASSVTERKPNDIFQSPDSNESAGYNKTLRKIFHMSPEKFSKIVDAANQSERAGMLKILQNINKTLDGQQEEIPEEKREDKLVYAKGDREQGIVRFSNATMVLLLARNEVRELAGFEKLCRSVKNLFFYIFGTGSNKVVDEFNKAQGRFNYTSINDDNIENSETQSSYSGPQSSSSEYSGSGMENIQVDDLSGLNKGLNGINSFVDEQIKYLNNVHNKFSKEANEERQKLEQISQRLEAAMNDYNSALKSIDKRNSNEGRELNQINSGYIWVELQSLSNLVDTLSNGPTKDALTIKILELRALTAPSKGFEGKGLDRAVVFVEAPKAFKDSLSYVNSKIDSIDSSIAQMSNLTIRRRNQLNQLNRKLNKVNRDNILYTATANESSSVKTNTSIKTNNKTLSIELEKKKRELNETEEALKAYDLMSGSTKSLLNEWNNDDFNNGDFTKFYGKRTAITNDIYNYLDGDFNENIQGSPTSLDTVKEATNKFVVFLNSIKLGVSPDDASQILNFNSNADNNQKLKNALESYDNAISNIQSVLEDKKIDLEEEIQDLTNRINPKDKMEDRSENLENVKNKLYNYEQILSDINHLMTHSNSSTIELFNEKREQVIKHLEKALEALGAKYPNNKDSVPHVLDTRGQALHKFAVFLRLMPQNDLDLAQEALEMYGEEVRITYSELRSKKDELEEKIQASTNLINQKDIKVKQQSDQAKVLTVLAARFKELPDSPDNDPNDPALQKLLKEVEKLPRHQKEQIYLQAAQYAQEKQFIYGRSSFYKGYDSKSTAQLIKFGKAVFEGKVENEDNATLNNEQRSDILNLGSSFNNNQMNSNVNSIFNNSSQNNNSFNLSNNNSSNSFDGLSNDGHIILSDGRILLSQSKPNPQIQSNGSVAGSSKLPLVKLNNVSTESSSEIIINNASFKSEMIQQRVENYNIVINKIDHLTSKTNVYNDQFDMIEFNKETDNLIKDLNHNNETFNTLPPEKSDTSSQIFDRFVFLLKTLKEQNDSIEFIRFSLNRHRRTAGEFIIELNEQLTEQNKNLNNNKFNLSSPSQSNGSISTSPLVQNKPSTHSIKNNALSSDSKTQKRLDNYYIVLNQLDYLISNSGINRIENVNDLDMGRFNVLTDGIINTMNPLSENYKDYIDPFDSLLPQKSDTPEKIVLRFAYLLVMLDADQKSPSSIKKLLDEYRREAVAIVGELDKQKVVQNKNQNNSSLSSNNVIINNNNNNQIKTPFNAPIKVDAPIQSQNQIVLSKRIKEMQELLGDYRIMLKYTDDLIEKANAKMISGQPATGYPWVNFNLEKQKQGTDIKKIIGQIPGGKIGNVSGNLLPQTSDSRVDAWNRYRRLLLEFKMSSSLTTANAKASFVKMKNEKLGLLNNYKQALQVSVIKKLEEEIEQLKLELNKPQAIYNDSGLSDAEMFDGFMNGAKGSIFEPIIFTDVDEKELDDL